MPEIKETQLWDPNCPTCLGVGHVVVDEVEHIVQRCRCATLRLIAKRLGPEITKARPVITTTPLVTTQDQYITGPWDLFCAHFRCVALPVLAMDETWFHVITTDERLKTIFVGGESTQTKVKKRDDKAPPLDSVADLVSGPDLVVIRLGFLGYKNVAAAGALRESMLVRKALAKPTWLVYDQNLGPIYSWSPELDAQVSKDYIGVNLEEGRSIAALPVVAVPASEKSTHDRSKVFQDPSLSVCDSDDFSALLNGSSKTQKKRRGF